MYFIHNTLAYCYNEKRNYPKMIENWEIAKNFLEKNNDSDYLKNMGHLLNNLGMSYFGCNTLNKAQENFE